VWVQLFGRRLIVIGTPGQSTANALQTFTGTDVYLDDLSTTFHHTSATLTTDGRWATLEITVQKLGSDFASSASGNIVNTGMGHIRPEFYPPQAVGLFSGVAGQIAHGYLDSNGQLVVSAMLPNLTWTVGTSISWNATYPLAVPLPSVAPTIITPGPSPYSSWQTPTLLNGWVAYDSGWSAPRWRQTADGEIVCAGLMKNGSVGSVGTPAFVVPAELAPAGTTSVGELCMTPANGGPARIDALGNGYVSVIALFNGANSAYVSLNGVRWYPAGV
jgi:hypothetical protein